MFFILLIPTSYAQEKAALPFAIADEKKLDDDELKEKKEGWFLTGLPQVSTDPVNGTGVGLDGFLYFNGDKSDPFFEYTPYRKKFEIHTFITNKAEKEIALALDIPYIFESKWRLRIETAFEDNPNLLYFGSTAATMNPLNYLGTTQNTYSSYSNAQDTVRAGNVGEAAFVTDAYLNTYRKQEMILNARMERSIQDGTMRLVGGIELAKELITVFDGQTVNYVDANGNTQSATAGTSLLSSDATNNGVRGLGNYIIPMLQFGIVYDTRDLEPDPKRGIFAEVTDEFSIPAIGSTYNFNKAFFHIKGFTEVLPRVVFAARTGFEISSGSLPFFEYQDAWSTEGSIEGLGGLRTLRGYKQNRFMAPIMSFSNLELRYRFGSASIFDQNLSFMIVPFFDFGRVWNQLSEVGLGGFRYDEGLGLRIAWNQSTILMFDYAQSIEDQQFFFNFGHIF